MQLSGRNHPQATNGLPWTVAYALVNYKTGMGCCLRWCLTSANYLRLPLGSSMIPGNQLLGQDQGSTVISRAAHLPRVCRWDLAARQSAVVNSIACPGRRAVNVPVALSVLMVVRTTTDGCELEGSGQTGTRRFPV